MGRLVRDPELRYTQNGTAVASFTLAVDRRFNRDKADFIKVIAWRNTAEFCANHFQKGSKIALVGSIQTRSWEDDDGKKHGAVEVIADSVYFADSNLTM
jgi:single-strand DNA-binding protein